MRKITALERAQSAYAALTGTDRNDFELWLSGYSAALKPAKSAAPEKRKKVKTDAGELFKRGERLVEEARKETA